jgi:hypothetical protein
MTQLITLIDRLIQLKGYRNCRYRSLLNELLGPAFDELLLVPKDYIQIFEETRVLLPSAPPEAGYSEYISQLKKPAEYLRKKRMEPGCVTLGLSGRITAGGEFVSLCSARCQ